MNKVKKSQTMIRHLGIISKLLIEFNTIGVVALVFIVPSNMFSLKARELLPTIPLE
jgi:hypothetical protein